MTKPAQKSLPSASVAPLVQPPSIDDVPVTYADNVIAVSIGPFVSKIVLAMEPAPQQFKATMQITLPTNVLHGVASQILEIMGQANLKEQLENDQKTFIASLP